jgi:hypothetical protein
MFYLFFFLEKGNRGLTSVDAHSRVTVTAGIVVAFVLYRAELPLW